MHHDEKGKCLGRNTYSKKNVIVKPVSPIKPSSVRRGAFTSCLAIDIVRVTYVRHVDTTKPVSYYSKKNLKRDLKYHNYIQDIFFFQQYQNYNLCKE